MAKKLKISNNDKGKKKKFKHIKNNTLDKNINIYPKNKKFQKIKKKRNAKSVYRHISKINDIILNDLNDSNISHTNKIDKNNDEAYNYIGIKDSNKDTKHKEPNSNITNKNYFLQINTDIDNLKVDESNKNNFEEIDDIIQEFNDMGLIDDEEEDKNEDENNLESNFKFKNSPFNNNLKNYDNKNIFNYNYSKNINNKSNNNSKNLNYPFNNWTNNNNINTNQNSLDKNNIKEINNKIINENVDLYINKISENQIECRLKLFNLQKYQGKKKIQTEKIYKCINLRKDEHLRKNNLKRFCESTIKYNLYYKNYIMTRDHSKECYDFYNPLVNQSKDDKSEVLKNKRKIYKDILIKYYNENLNINLHKFKEKSIEIYKNGNYEFEYDSIFIKNLFYKLNNSENNTDKIIFKYNLTLTNKSFLKSYNIDNEMVNNQNKKYKTSKFILWGADKMILRAKKSKHFFIDSTFKKPKDYYELFIVMFIDILTDKSYPVFYAILSYKTEYIYKEVLRKICNILEIDINKNNDITITIDFEVALINAIKIIFGNIRIIGCLFHYKQNLIKNARSLGLLKNINKDKTLNVINKQLSRLPFIYYKDGINEIQNIINNIKTISKEFEEFGNYFENQWYKYFKNNMLNYYKIKKIIRTNNTIENYNKQLKLRHGPKKNLNWPEFLEMLLNEENYFNKKIDDDLYNNKKYSDNNKKVNIEIDKNTYETNNIINLDNNYNNIKWFLNEKNSCRIDCFLTLFVFCIYPHIEKNELKNHKEILYLIDISEKLLSGNFQQIKMDYWIYLNNNDLDIIDNRKGLYKFGCISSLFTLLNNCNLFSIHYKSKTTCYVCSKEIINNNYYSPLIPLNKYEIKYKNLNNVINQKFFPCKTTCFTCNKTPEEREKNMDSIINYYEIIFPKFLFFIVDIDYNDLKLFDNEISNIFNKDIVLNINNYNSHYKFTACILMPNNIHYSIIFYNSKLTYNNIEIMKYYLHDGSLNNGEIIKIDNNFDIKMIDIPKYLFMYIKED